MGAPCDPEAAPCESLPPDTLQTSRLSEEGPVKVADSSDIYLSRRSSRMQEVEKVALTTLAAVLVVVALVELILAAPVVWKAAITGRTAAQQGGQEEPYPRFLVLGDWGRDGAWNQSLVATAMGVKAERMGGVDFVISTGDNFYESGLVSPLDPQFNTSFMDIYHQPSLQVPWHVVLGNHDWGEYWTDHLQTPPADTCGGSPPEECFYGPLHQLDVRLTERDPRWHCERNFMLSLVGGKVDIFFIDTTSIIDSYLKDVWAGNRGGLLEQSWQDQLSELEARLARSQAQWKLLVGHHPIRNGRADARGAEDLQARVEPLLVQYGVDAYYAGHDHLLQYVYSPEVHYHHFISGAGSKLNTDVADYKRSKFFFGGNGFVAVSMGKDNMHVEFIGLESEQPLYTVDVPRNQSNGARRK